MGKRLSVSALVGLALTAALLGVFSLGWAVAGLTFPPFGFFDWLARHAPGSLLTAGIDAMVAAIRRLGVANTSATAKQVELGSALGLFLAAGVVVALILAVLPRRRILIGAVLGAALGLIVARAEVAAGASVKPWDAVWVAGLFLAWGATLGWAVARLAAARAEAARDAAQRLDRRRFLLRLGGATAAVTVTGAVVGSLSGRRSAGANRNERWSASHELPNLGAAVEAVRGTRPELTPVSDHYRIDINAIPPSVDGSSWRLKVGGLVEHPLELTLAALRSYAPLHQFITLECISNPVAGDLIGTQRWTGVSLQQLLPDLGLWPAATHLKLTSADGFFETVALDTVRADRRVMLAYDWDGVPLPVAHGFPLRLYVPNLYGMKQPKWITSIQAIDREEAGYWVLRGWSATARVKATSVIDTVEVAASTRDASGQTLVPVGGIAYAAARGISRVEVRVDGGDWRPARLRTPLSDRTWVIWRCDLPLSAGSHTLTVRCTDGQGREQIIEESPPHPDGASGLQSRQTTLRT